MVRHKSVLYHHDHDHYVKFKILIYCDSGQVDKEYFRFDGMNGDKTTNTVDVF